MLIDSASEFFFAIEFWGASNIVNFSGVCKWQFFSPRKGSTADFPDFRAGQIQTLPRSRVAGRRQRGVLSGDFTATGEIRRLKSRPATQVSTPGWCGLPGNLIFSLAPVLLISYIFQAKIVTGLN
jgi:hypothetical protein